MSWRSEARCIDLEIQERLLFFGDSDYPLGTQAQYRWARTFCYECPVQVECLMWAVKDKERTAVWGGLTESQRRRHAVPYFRTHGMTEETAQHVIVRLSEGVRPPTDAYIAHMKSVVHGSEPLPSLMPA